MPILENPKHEAFAQAVAKGMRGAPAYRKHVSGGKCSNDAANVNASKLLREGTKVALRVKELREAGSKKATQKVAFEIADAIQFCVDVITTPIGDVDANHKLCQEVTDTMFGKKVKMPAKLDALDKLARLRDWFVPDKSELDGKLEIVIRKL